MLVSPDPGQCIVTFPLISRWWPLKYFYCHPYLGMIQFDKYLSIGLKPPTRFLWQLLSCILGEAATLYIHFLTIGCCLHFLQRLHLYVNSSYGWLPQAEGIMVMVVGFRAMGLLQCFWLKNRCELQQEIFLGVSVIWIYVSTKHSCIYNIHICFVELYWHGFPRLISLSTSKSFQCTVSISLRFFRGIDGQPPRIVAWLNTVLPQTVAQVNC